MAQIGETIRVLNNAATRANERIADILNEQSVVINERLDPGRGNVPQNCARFPSGVRWVDVTDTAVV